ncbi:hypothetical protein [Alteribacillus sp. HJP-4]|uniref:hypothetical protein n=1 Tax=Alteribacillus sp. HJP-4 TaxID=2775394 RepID=UPI0035CCD31D
MSFQPNWPLIIFLACTALLRPLLSMTGALEAIGQPQASIIITILITVVWIIAASKKSSHPIRTLMLTGFCYGVLAILISAIMSPMITGTLQGPLKNPFAVVSVLITNIVWGLAAGVIASLARRAE